MIAASAALAWWARARFLFSWDSANFGLALSGIDIAQHRPHPPGYVGYVVAARFLSRVVPSASDAFVCWNIVAVSASAILLYRIAGRQLRGVLAVAALLSSPLLLFYAGTAEIYASELAAATLIVSAACHCWKGGSGAPYLLALAFIAGALFKLSTAVFLIPLCVFSVLHAEPPTRRRAALAPLAISVGVVAAVFLLLQPGLVSMVWTYFLDTTARSRVVGAEAADLGRSLNRNIRDTLVASVAATGFNIAAVAAWLRRRSSPGQVDARLLWLWILPWCFELVLIHIGKPGYVLPLLPLLALLAAEWSAGSGKTGLALAVASAAGNVLWFTLLPASVAANDTRPYRQKPFLARVASDLAPLTFPTVSTLRESDSTIRGLLHAAATCSDGSWVVVAGSYGADWRRTMYYLPKATAIRKNDQKAFEFVGREGTFSQLSGVLPLVSRCGLLWTDLEPPAISSNATPDQVPSVGWQLGPGVGRVTSHALQWTAERAGEP
jgi:hypothetical protein